MAFGKIPLFILFAGRNHFLIWVTGWSYSTFLHFHKVVDWWMFVDSLIHSVSYTIITSNYVNQLHRVFFACGIAATVICGILILRSMHAFRSIAYEYFLLFHIALAIFYCHVLVALQWFGLDGMDGCRMLRLVLR